MEPVLEMARYGLAMWVTGFAASYKILTMKRLMEVTT